mmetsp:Transcript_21604/g.52005  ORF Transcript_21604/g.52005 Transcript_21604/m.52005 type:complete len:288 (-) Transcript_21604:1661-2524(-)
MAAEAEATPEAPPPALWMASRNGEVGEVRELIEHGAEIEERGSPDWYTPLLATAHCGQREVARVLLELGADISVVDKWGMTPLHVASLQGHDDVALVLLEHGAKISAQDNYGEMPLHSASTGGHEEAALVLLLHGADVSATDNDGETPLHKAVRYGNAVSVVRLLLQRGADASAKNTTGETPLHYAADEGYTRVVEQMLDSGAELGAATRGGEEVVAVLLDKGADLSAEDGRGKTPLEVATSLSHLEIAAMIKAEAIRRAKCLAFAMGKQERLGAGSRVLEPFELDA